MLSLLLQLNWSTLETRIGGERANNLLWCLGIIIGTLLLKRPITVLLSRFISGITNRFTDKNHGSKFRLLIHHPLEQLLQTILFYIAINQLSIILSQFIFKRYSSNSLGNSLRIGDVTDHVFLFLTILFTTLLLSRVIDFVYFVQQDKAQDEENRERQQLLPLLKEMAKLILWTIGIFWILGAVFHVNIPALIAGLGIGGIAIALAAKESVENLFAAFTILTDKPFHASDNIRLGAIEGVVERIGFRSTRLRSPDGSAYIIPNKKLVNENLENLTYRSVTRVKIPVNIKYGIPYEDLRLVIQQIQKTVQEFKAIKEPIEVSLESFGENVFQILISYHLRFPLDANISATAIRQDVTMQVYKIISKYTGSTAEGIEIPEPDNNDNTLNNNAVNNNDEDNNII